MGFLSIIWSVFYQMLDCRKSKHNDGCLSKEEITFFDNLFVIYILKTKQNKKQDTSKGLRETGVFILQGCNKNKYAKVPN